jgi:hypothetical protein
MAFLKYANAAVVRPNVSMPAWDEVRHRAVQMGTAFDKRATAQVVLKEYDPSQFLLSHCTIIASVDTEKGPGQLGRHFEEGFTVNRRYADYYITPGTSKFINNNQDSWERKLLLATFKTFVGGDNFVEHLQLPEMSKGKIIDAAARDLGESVYVDILVATDRKHKPLIDAIASGQLSTLSMGCQVSHCTCSKCGNVAEDETQMCGHIRYSKGNTFVDSLGKTRKIAELCFTPETRVVLADGSRRAINDLQVGDMVLSHTGHRREITEIHSRHFNGDLVTLKAEGVPQTFRVTPGHPFWVLSPRGTCSCGCGNALPRPKNFERSKYWRSYLAGHNPRVMSLQPPEFTFKEAGELQTGDLLALPIPTISVRPSGKVDSERAELLGWFLAEGSYIKHHGSRCGIQFTLNAEDEKSVADRLALLLEQCFEPELQKRRMPRRREVVKRNGTDKILDVLWGDQNSPKLTSDIATELPGIQNLNAILHRYEKLGVISSRALCKGERLDILGRKRSRARVWWFSGQGQLVSRRRLGAEVTALRDYEQQLENRAIYGAKSVPHVYVNPRKEGGFKLVVNYYNLQAARWFFKHAGEYADSKRLSAEVLLWPVPLQHHILRGYVLGDGHADSTARHFVSSVSETLISQMQIVAARCNFWTRRQVVFEGRSVELSAVVGGDSVPVGVDNCKPRHELHFQPSDETTQFFGFDVVHERHNQPKFHNYRGYMLYPVRAVSRQHYEGDVSNISVSKDESYLVEGLAVHNCGHVTDPASVKFIEASWVANPAFTGAVLRNILSPQEIAGLAPKMQLAFSQPTRVADPNTLQKAARRVLAQDPPAEENPTEGDVPAEEAPEDPMETAVNDLADHIRQKAVEKIRGEMASPPQTPSPGSENMNESLIKSALARNPVLRQAAGVVLRSVKNPLIAKRIIAGLLYHSQGGWQAVRAQKFSSREILGISRFVDLLNDSPRMAGDNRIYRTVMAVGGATAYSDVESYLLACRRVIGRDMTQAEKEALIVKGRLFDLGQ